MMLFRANTMLNSRLLQFWLTVIVPIIIFWLILYSLGYPRPFEDDLFFIGAALNLVKNGDLVNPLLSQWSERTTDYFFVQPPFYSYVLAGWLALVGISTQAILFFYFFCYVTFSIFTALILSFYRFSRWAIYAVILCFASWILFTGLRHDVLGITFLAIGTWFLLRDRPWYYFWGFSFLGFAILTVPVMIAYGSCFGIALVYRNWAESQSPIKAYLFSRIFAFIAAVLLTSILFLFAINFQIDRFLSDLAWHSSFRRQSLTEVIPAIIWMLRIGYGEILHGSLLSLYFATLFLGFYKSRKNPKTLNQIILVLTISGILNLLTYASSFIGIFRFLSWLTIILIIAQSSLKSVTQKILIAVAVVVFLVNNLMTIIAITNIEAASPQQYQAVREYIQNHAEKQYIIDEVAARFVFNYQLPDNSISWNSSQPAPAFVPTSIADKPDNAVWIIATQKAWHISELPDYPRVEILGQRFDSIALRPYDIILVE